MPADRGYLPKGSMKGSSVGGIAGEYRYRRNLRLKGLPAPKTVIEIQNFIQDLDALRKTVELTEYQKRLETFSPEKWTGIPWPISPIECALYGWTCFMPGILRCQKCKETCSFDSFSYHEIFGALTKTDLAMRSWLVAEFRKKVTVSGHGSSCSFRPICRTWQVDQFKLFSRKEFQKNFEERLQSLATLGDLLPVVGVRFYAQAPLAEDLMKCERVINLAPGLKEITLQTALILACYGWKVLSESTDQRSLFCQECRCRVDFSSFCAVERIHVLEENETSNFRPDSFSTSQSDQYRMNCENEHYFWCPWVRSVEFPTWLDEDAVPKSTTNLSGADLTSLAFREVYLTQKTLVDSDEEFRKTKRKLEKLLAEESASRLR